jgi:thioredoxin-related protein
MLRIRTLQGLALLAIALSSACETKADTRPITPSRLKPANSIAWFHDLYQARKRSLESGRPMLIVFGAPWCHYCREMEHTTLVDPKIVNYVSTCYVPVRLDADRDKRIAEILKVKPIPCTVVLSPNAELLAKVVGYRDVPKYYGELEKARRRLVSLQQHH